MDFCGSHFLFAAKTSSWFAGSDALDTHSWFDGRRLSKRWRSDSSVEMNEEEQKQSESSSLSAASARHHLPIKTHRLVFKDVEPGRVIMSL